MLDILVTLMLPRKFQVNFPFILGEEAKINFQDDGHRVSHRNNFIFFFFFFFFFFLVYKSPHCFLSSFKSIGLSVQEKKRRINLQDGVHGDHFGFLIETNLAPF